MNVEYWLILCIWDPYLWLDELLDTHIFLKYIFKVSNIITELALNGFANTFDGYDCPWFWAFGFWLFYSATFRDGLFCDKKHGEHLQEYIDILQAQVTGFYQYINFIEILRINYFNNFDILYPELRFAISLENRADYLYCIDDAVVAYFECLYIDF